MNDLLFGTILDQQGLHGIADLWDRFVTDNPTTRTASVTNPYHTLGIGENATPEEMKAAFKQLARRLHPDVNPDTNASEQFRDIKDAYEMLTSGTPFVNKKDDFSFINNNSRAAQHISDEELKQVLLGTPIDERRFFAHLNRCDACRSKYLKAHKAAKKPKKKFFGMF